MSNKIDLQLADLPLLLRFIPADSREVWIQVGMGLKVEFGEAAFDDWDDWSQRR
ncbi:Primase C terminal 2 (PriCT-2) [Azotobacter beijerinckii]|uniref:Primase C terminal 2 (PriCT-2) n=1 Tax=Azotobacter beijerinckii TaxID=170623 RepID=A0A1H7ADW2_9GAMM|nr:PriCT-2 domain-containing protein [Azotobacter beijerinckii]SEJ63568.1 Primase C terminal 2 (PriCT-2) [Azotobacter beijerinckii]